MIAITHGATSPARAGLGSLLTFPHLVPAPSSSSKVEYILILISQLKEKKQSLGICLLPQCPQGKGLKCTPKDDSKSKLIMLL